MDDYGSWDWGYGGGDYGYPEYYSGGYPTDYSSWGGYSGGGNYGGGGGGGGGNSWLPNTWNALMGMAPLIGAAVGGGSKNQKPQYSYSPAQMMIGRQMMNVANTPVYNQESVDNWLRLAQNSNVAAGLAPDASSGSFRNTLAKLALGDIYNQAKFKAGVLGNVGNMAGQGIAQQAPNPWYQDVFMAMQNQAQMANMMKLFNPQGSYTNTAPWMSGLMSMMGIG